MRNAGGYMLVENRDGTIEERDTYTCAHGNEIVVVPTGTDPASLGAHCKTCDAFICKRCASKQECIPFEKWLDYKEGRGTPSRRDDVRRQLLEAEFRARRIEVHGAPPPRVQQSKLIADAARLTPEEIMERNILQRRHDAYLATRFGFGMRR